MQPRRRAIGATALAAVAVLVIIAVAGGYWAYASVPRPKRDHESRDDLNFDRYLDQPPKLKRVFLFDRYTSILLVRK